MSPELQNKILNLTRQLKDLNYNQNKHFTYLVWKRRIVSIGFNDYNRTHPLAKKLGYYQGAIHSELDAFIKLRNKNLAPQITLINVRINSLGIIGMSRPCKYCGPFLYQLSYKNVYYTDRSGNFVKEW